MTNKSPRKRAPKAPKSPAAKAARVRRPKPVPPLTAPTAGWLLSLVNSQQLQAGAEDFTAAFVVVSQVKGELEAIVKAYAPPTPPSAE